MSYTNLWCDLLCNFRKPIIELCHKETKECIIFTKKNYHLDVHTFLTTMIFDTINDSNIILSFYLYSIYHMLSDLNLSIVTCIDKVIQCILNCQSVKITTMNNICILILALSQSEKTNFNPCSNLMKACIYCKSNNHTKLIDSISSTMFCTYRMQLLSDITQHYDQYFVPMLSKSGIFGYKQYLKLFFNKIIPFSVATDVNVKINLHRGTVASRYDVMAHDLEHGLRSIPIMCHVPWYEYLKQCYEVILNEDNERLLIFLFFVINEMGIMPKGDYKPEKYSVRTFEKTVSQRYSFSRYADANIECDENTTKLLSKFVDVKVVDKKRMHEDVAYCFLLDSYEEFNKRFDMLQIAETMR